VEQAGVLGDGERVVDDVGLGVALGVLVLGRHALLRVVGADEALAGGEVQGDGEVPVTVGAGALVAAAAEGPLDPAGGDVLEAHVSGFSVSCL
jgi:hypothetical protein